MLITNATGRKIRLSVFRDISEDEIEEKFAYIIADECSLALNGDENYRISLEESESQEKK